MLHFPRKPALALPAFGALCLAAGTARAQDSDIPVDMADGASIRIFEPSYYDEFDPVTALELVFRTPGFNPQESDGGRGLSGVRSNILINGERPPPKGQSIRQQLREMPVDGVERIELIDAGARQGIDMQGYPQVVNVITVPNAPAYYEVTTDLRRSGTGAVRQENDRSTQVQATGSFSWNSHEFTLSGETQDDSQRSPSGFVAIDPANPEQRISSLSSSESADQGIELSASFDLPADSSLSFNSQFSTDEFSSAPISLLDDDSDAVQESYLGEDDRRDISTEYRRPFGPGGSIMVAWVDAKSTDQSESSLTIGDLNRSSINNRESGESAARLRVTRSPTDKLTLRTTVSSAFNYFEGGFQIFENGVELDIDGSDSRVEEDRQSLEGSVDWNWSDQWTLIATVGMESYEITTRDATSGTQTDPRGQFSISYRPQPRTTLSFESQRSIGQLSFNQFLASSNLSSEIVTAGAEALEPERYWQHTASYDKRFGDVGVLRLELSREKTDNPVRTVALSDEITVAQNTSPRTIDRVQARVEYPFERFGREDLILSLNTMIADSTTVDPVTGEVRDASGIPMRWTSIELRRDPGDGKLSWGFSWQRVQQGDNYSVRTTRTRNANREWGAFVEWEPIEGLRLRTNVDGPRTNISETSFFGQVRQPGLDPTFIATTRNIRDRSASFTVEWRRRPHLEIRGTLSSRPQYRTEEALTPFGEMTGPLLATGVDSTPRATVRFRVFR